MPGGAKLSDLSKTVFGKYMNVEKAKQLPSKQFRNYWELFLIVIAVAFLFAYAYPAFFPNEKKIIYESLEIFQWSCYFIFAIDLIVGLIRSKNRALYIKQHPIEIIAVLFPFLRPLRVLRFLSVSSLVFQKTALGKASSVTFRLAVASLLLLFVGAVEITLTERSIQGSNIKNIGDGLWWATTTVTTVGYGDRYPVSVSGKLIALGLMLVGIALIGAITATFAAWFVRMVQDENKNM